MSCQLIQAATLSMIVFLLLCIQPNHVAGSGPDLLGLPHIWNLTMSQCFHFRNESVLRPRFILWPESIKGVPFRCCCKYQPPDNTSLTVSLTSFKLTKNSYGPDGGTLMPALYFDPGLIVKKYSWYWQHWILWRLPTALYSAPLYCEAVDLFRLYYHLQWNHAYLRWMETAAALLVVLLVSGIGIPLYLQRKVQWEELFSDLFHLLLLALVGSCLMEGIGHSAILEWRSQLMYNGGVMYSYLTLFVMVSALVRNSIEVCNISTDWKWQEVFAQFVAQFVLSMYLCLVEDASGRHLEGVVLLVLGTVIASSIWSAGVEMLHIVLWSHVLTTGLNLEILRGL